MSTELKPMNMKRRTERVELSEDLREEMKKLKDELADLREQLKGVSEERRRRRGAIRVDIGDRVRDYVADVVEGVAEGIYGEVEKSVLIGPGGRKIVRIVQEGTPEMEDEGVEASFPKTAEVMNALSHEHRLRILDELMRGGKYINELQERLSEITTSTLSSHLKVLEEAGLVVQEKMRGRYLITIPGRTAFKMARRVARFAERRNKE
ncbi:MAG: ArsR/SmtB family transcription factor [Candidatus Bathyarchaeia archaeon]